MRELAPAIAAVLALAGCARAPLGEPCGSDGECASGLCLAELPGGLCSSRCEASCEEGSVCVELAGESYCMPACSGAGGCRDGYACSLGHCDLPCGSDDECPAHARCAPASSGCVLATDLPLGAPCVQGHQCESETCVVPTGAAAGVCSLRCGGQELCAPGLPCGLVEVDGRRYPLCRPPAGRGRAGDLCSAGGDCLAGLCALGQCVFPCDAAGSCEPGSSCRPGTVEAEGEELRVDHCSPEAAPGVRVVDFGAIATDRGVARIELELPEGAVSLAVVGWTDDLVRLGARNLEGPEGRVLIDGRGIGPISIYDREDEVTVLVPNTDSPQAEALPGRYTMELWAQEVSGTRLLDALIRVRALVKVREDGLCQDGTLTFNVHLAPGFRGGLDAATAGSSAYFRDAFGELERFYAGGCGVRLGSVRYFDMVDRFGAIGSMAELEEMFSVLSAGTPRATVNLFVVRDLSGVSEWVAGIAGGLPGPPGVTGTPHSGVAVEASGDSVIVGDTIAHELGHYLGLYHPTEMDGMLQDPILDTPTCEFDPGRPETMMRCETFDNFMFPVLTGTAADVTPGQCLVIRANPGV